MFTSRAEHRLLLGCDSVYARLTPIADRLGILDEERRSRVASRIDRMERANAAGALDLRPDAGTNAWLSAAGVTIAGPTTVARLLQRADLDLDRLLAAAAEPLPELTAAFEPLSDEEREGVVSQLRYSGYIERQKREAEKLLADETLRIPETMTYALPGLSREMTEKLSRLRPTSLGQASRIPGVTPAAISIVRMHLRRGGQAAR